MTEKFNAANTSFLLGKSYRRKVFLVNLYMLSTTLLDPNILSRVDENSSEYNGEKLAEKEGDEENLFRLLRTEEGGDKHLLSMKQVLLDEYGSIENLKKAFKSTDNSDKDDIENYFSEIKKKAPKEEVEKKYYGISKDIHNSDPNWKPDFLAIAMKLKGSTSELADLISPPGKGYLKGSSELGYRGKDIVTGEQIKIEEKDIIDSWRINNLTEEEFNTEKKRLTNNKKDAEAGAGEVGAKGAETPEAATEAAPAAAVEGAAGEDGVAGDDSVGAEAPGAAPAAPVDNSGAVEGEVAKEKNTDIQFIITEMDDKNDFANSIEVQENGKTIIEKLSKGDIMSYTSSDGNTKRYINILGLNDKEINYEEFDYSESEQEWKWYYSISKGMMKVANPTRILSNHSDNKYRKGIEWNKFTNLKKEENITTKKQAEKEAKAAAAPGTETPVAVTAPGDNNNEKLEKIKKDEKEAAKIRDASLKVNENNSRKNTKERLDKRSQDDGSGSKDKDKKNPSTNLIRSNSSNFGGSRKKNKTKKTRKSRKK